MFSVDWFSVERRLHAAAVAGLCAFVVACGGGDDPAAPDGAAPTAPPVVTPPVVTPPVVTPPVVTPPVVTPPVLTITQQPADAAVTAGAQATFVVAATCSAGALNIQWQRNTGADGAFVAIASATTPSYALTSTIADNGAKLRAALDCGGESATTSATTSATGTLTVSNPAAGVLSPVAVTGLRHQAPLSFSRGIVREASGSYAFVSGNVVLRLSADLQSITPVAGSFADPSGTTTDGVGAAAHFNAPYGITAGADGTLYVTERFGYVIRRIATDGTVTTIAGAPGQSGSADGTGNAARFYLPSGIAVGPDGDLYVADRTNQLIRRVTSAGVVTTYAGISGMSGHVDGVAGGAKFFFPSGLAVGSDGTVYVADADGRIRFISRNGNAAGTVGTLAGAGTNTVTAAMDGTGTAAVIVTPEQMAISGTTLYVRDGAGLVRKIDTGTGVVTTLAGTPAATVPRDGPRGAAAIETALNGGGLTPTADGGLMITETNFFVGAVRRVDASGVVTTLAVGLPYGFNNMTAGTGVLAQLPFAWFPDDAMTGGLSHFSTPVAVAPAPDGSLVIGSRASLRRIAPGGAVSSLIGLIGAGSFEGTGSAADLINASQAVLVDPAGAIYFSDVSCIRVVDATHTARTIAGAPPVYADSSGLGQGAVDGPGATARFSNVTGLARSTNGDLYAADSLNYAIRRIDPAGNVSTHAGVMGQKGTTDGPLATARFTGPLDLAMAPDGSMWLLDGGRNETPTVRRIASDGTVTSLPTKARRLTVDPAGNVYVISEGGDLASLAPATGALTVLVPLGPRLTFGSDPRLGTDSSWAFSAVGVKQLVLMSEHQLIRATLP